jgi:trimeric autotransporter adhesin
MWWKWKLCVIDCREPGLNRNINKAGCSVYPTRRSTFFTATGIYSDNSTTDISQSVSWSSQNSSTVRVTGDGEALGNAEGTTTISARLGDVVGSALITVISNDKDFSSITVISPVDLICGGYPVQLKAIGNYQDNTSEDITGIVEWSWANGSGILDNTGTLLGGRGTVQATMVNPSGEVISGSLFVASAICENSF